MWDRILGPEDAACPGGIRVDVHPRPGGEHRDGGAAFGSLLPRDCASPLASQHPIIRWGGLIPKNTLGALLILLKLLLSLPGVSGQGLLTIQIGVMLLNYPGKRRLVSQPSVLSAINALRSCFGKPPPLLR